jgi:hypothetical protein
MPDRPTIQKRAYLLNIAGVKMATGAGPASIDIEFTVDRSLTATANTAEIIVYNLSEDTRKSLQGFDGAVPVELFAGSDPGPSEPTWSPGLIFKGKLREITSANQGSNWITKVSSGDGDETNKLVSFSIGPGASLTDAVNKLIGEMQISIGNAKTAILGGSFLNGGGNQMPSGAIMHGPAGQQLERLLRSMGKTYSVQNGELQILDSGRPDNQTAYVVNASNGLVGSPEIGSVKNSSGKKVKGGCKFRSLLTTEIYPGRECKVESNLVNGHFRVISCTYFGQYAGPDWYVDVSSVAIKTDYIVLPTVNITAGGGA